MNPTERTWRQDFANTAATIPESWLHRDDDGFVGIKPEYRNTPQVVLYHKLMCTGYAKGWI